MTKNTAKLVEFYLFGHHWSSVFRKFHLFPSFKSLPANFPNFDIANVFMEIIIQLVQFLSFTHMHGFTQSKLCIPSAFVKVKVIVYLEVHLPPFPSLWVKHVLRQKLPSLLGHQFNSFENKLQGLVIHEIWQV